MNLGTIIAFQFGSRGAIEKVARGSGALWTGLALVLTVSVARNYDQSWIMDSPLWLVGNVVYSLVSSWVIFALVYKLFLKRRFPKADQAPSFGRQYRSFLGLFWMTSPVAWLYAIPVERWVDSYQAAQWNLALLAIVSLWRVLLLARVFSVVTQTGYGRTLLWTLFVASTEVVVVMVLGFFSRFNNMNLMASMGGMRNSPEEGLMVAALGIVFLVSLIVCLVTIVALPSWRDKGIVEFFPQVEHSRVPWLALTVMLLCWVGVAVEPQRCLENNSHFDRLVRVGKYDEAMAYLTSRDEGDFSHYKKLAPDPYAWEVWEHLGPVLDRIDPDSPQWVRQHYLYHMEGVFEHSLRRHFSLEDRIVAYISILNAISFFPEANSFVERHRGELELLREVRELFKTESTEEVELERLLTEILGPLEEQ